MKGKYQHINVTSKTLMTERYGKDSKREEMIETSQIKYINELIVERDRYKKALEKIINAKTLSNAKGISINALEGR